VVEVVRVTADPPQLPLVQEESGDGTVWEVNFQIFLLFGMSELQAQLIWKDTKVTLFPRLPSLPLLIIASH
jgi:hypothetical protein